jgi:6-phosphogluconolactonase
VPLYKSKGDATEVAQENASAAIDAGWPCRSTWWCSGMGTDGHTASFFPGGTTLDAATDPACPQSVMAIEAPGAGEPRLTLTLPRIVEAGLLVLHIEGERKSGRAGTRRLRREPEADMPVRAVLRQDAKTPVEIYWAP